MAFCRRGAGACPFAADHELLTIRKTSGRTNRDACPNLSNIPQMGDEHSGNAEGRYHAILRLTQAAIATAAAPIAANTTHRLL